MKKDITITVTGIQTDTDGNSNKDTTKEHGSYYLKNNIHYVMVQNEITGQTARYKFNHRYLEVVKNGDINSKLYFEAGKVFSSLYKTKYGQFEFTYKTDTLSIIESEDQIKISAKYGIYSGSINNSDSMESLFSEDNLVSNNLIEIELN